MRVHKLMSIALVLLVSALCVTAASSRELHAVGPAEMQAAITAHVGDQASQRAAIQSLLVRPEVRQLAARSGFDLTQAQAAAAKLDGVELQRLAAQAAAAQEQLAGGDTVVITSAALLLALLIVVILVAL